MPKLALAFSVRSAFALIAVHVAVHCTFVFLVHSHFTCEIVETMRESINMNDTVLGRCVISWIISMTKLGT